MSPTLRIAFRFLTAKKRAMLMSLACIILGVGLFLVTKFVVTPYVVVGDSMSPTLKSWELCLMQRVRQRSLRRRNSESDG